MWQTYLHRPLVLLISVKKNRKSRDKHLQSEKVKVCLLYALKSCLPSHILGSKVPKISRESDDAEDSDEESNPQPEKKPKEPVGHQVVDKLRKKAPLSGTPDVGKKQNLSDDKEEESQTKR